MLKNIDRLRVAIQEWLIRNELDMDTKFYEIEQWRTRNEDYLNDSDLVLVFEGALYSMMNYGADTSEFEEYIESFGYYFEMGHAWNMGFYPIPDYNFTPVGGTYSEKLQDVRWKNKSKLVKERAGWACEDCGGKTQLETHHCYYTSMRDNNPPWEYPLSALRCLCRKCHEERAKEESRMRAYLARLTTEQIKKLRANIDNAFYWFNSDAVILFLSKLKHKDEDIFLAVNELLRNRNDTD